MRFVLVAVILSAHSAVATADPSSSPPYTAGRLRNDAGVLEEGADFYSEVHAQQVNCHGAINWHGQSLSVRAMTSRIYPVWKDGDRVDNALREWAMEVLEFYGQKVNSCGDLGDLRAANWGVYGGNCNDGLYDVAISAHRDDAAIMRRTADIVDCVRGRLGALQSERARQDATAKSDRAARARRQQVEAEARRQQAAAEARQQEAVAETEAEAEAHQRSARGAAVPNDPCGVSGASFTYTCPDGPITAGACARLHERPFSSSFAVPESALNGGAWRDGAYKLRFDTASCRVSIERDGDPCPTALNAFDVVELRGEVEAYCQERCGSRVSCRLVRSDGPSQPGAASSGTAVTVATPVMTHIAASAQLMGSLAAAGADIQISSNLRRTGQFEMLGSLGIMGDAKHLSAGESGLMLEWKQGAFSHWDDRGHGIGIELGARLRTAYIFGDSQNQPAAGFRVEALGRLGRSIGWGGVGVVLDIDIQDWEAPRVDGDTYSIDETLVSVGPEAWLSFGSEPRFFGRFVLRGLIGEANGLQGDLQIANGGFYVRLLGEAKTYTNTYFEAPHERGYEAPLGLTAIVAIGLRIPWGQEPSIAPQPNPPE